MAFGRIHGNDYRLVHFIAYNLTEPDFTLCFPVYLSYLIFSSLSVKRVFRRAIFLFTLLTSRWFASCLVETRKRRLNSSWCDSSSCFAKSSVLIFLNSLRSTMLTPYFA